jgi:hypothetical protein
MARLTFPSTTQPAGAIWLVGSAKIGCIFVPAPESTPCSKKMMMEQASNAAPEVGIRRDSVSREERNLVRNHSLYVFYFILSNY